MKKILAAIATSIALVLVGVTAWASIPGPNGTIYGCYKTSNGALIVIDSNATCPSGTVSLNWNQTGPQGPPGILSESSSSSFTSTTFPGSSWTSVLSVNLTLPTSQLVMLTGSFQSYGGDTGIRFSVDGAPIVGSIPSSSIASGLYEDANLGAAAIDTAIITTTLSAGSHTINFELYYNCSNCTATIGTRSLVVIG